MNFKTFFTVSVFLVGSFLCFPSFAQPKLGLKFSPAINSSRTLLKSDTLDIAPGPSAFRFSLGLIVDQRLTDTYFFSSGIIFVPKKVTIGITPENGGSYANSRETYLLQYLQIPLTLKLYTNEIAPSTNIFFQVGGAAEINIFNVPEDDRYTLIEKFKPMDASVILGSGIEFKAGLNTVLFFDVSYQRGLANLIKTSAPDLGNTFAIRSTVVMLDLGIKF